jgi:hypothetical protein
MQSSPLLKCIKERQVLHMVDCSLVLLMKRRIHSNQGYVIQEAFLELELVHDVLG